MDYKMLGRIGR